MNDIKISVILLTYNRERVFERALNSILQQDFENYEIVLIDNGSEDHTEQICLNYKEKYPIISFYRLDKNIGISGARNLGIEKAKGEFITFADDDDYCEPEMLRHMHELACEYQADIAVIGSVYECGEVLTPKYVYDAIYVLSRAKGVSEFLAREKYNSSTTSKLYSKRLFNEIRFPEGCRVDDIHIIYKLFTEAERVVAHGLPLYRYNRHQGNTTGFTTGGLISCELLDEYLEMEIERERYIGERLPELKEQVRYSRFSFMLSWIDRIGNENGYEKQIHYMRDELKKNYTEIMGYPWLTEKEKTVIHKLREEACI